MTTRKRTVACDVEHELALVVGRRVGQRRRSAAVEVRRRDLNARERAIAIQVEVDRAVRDLRGQAVAHRHVRGGRGGGTRIRDRDRVLDRRAGDRLRVDAEVDRVADHDRGLGDGDRRRLHLVRAGIAVEAVVRHVGEAAEIREHDVDTRRVRARGVRDDRAETGGAARADLRAERDRRDIAIHPPDRDAANDPDGDVGVFNELVDERRGVGQRLVDVVAVVDHDGRSRHVEVVRADDERIRSVRSGQHVVLRRVTRVGDGELEDFVDTVHRDARVGAGHFVDDVADAVVDEERGVGAVVDARIAVAGARRRFDHRLRCGADVVGHRRAVRDGRT